MKTLVAIDDMGCLANKEGTLLVDSRYVAEIFEKRHDNVLRDIQKLIEDEPEFSLLNFEEIKYKDDKNRRQPCYLMTRDGFTMLVMGFTGAKARKFKLAYIQRFNQMEKQIQNMLALKLEFPELTDRIKRMHDEPKPYHYSNEINMIYKIVLGMNAKQFRKEHDLDADAPIRPHLTKEQSDMLLDLQRMDYMLTFTQPDFQDRKEMLKAFAERKRLEADIAKLESDD